MKVINFDSLFMEGTQARWLEKLMEDMRAGALTKGENASLVAPRIRVSEAGIEVREWDSPCEMVIILLTPIEHVIRYELGGIPGINKTPVHVFGSSTNTSLSSVNISFYPLAENEGTRLNMYTFYTGQIPVLSLLGMWILNHKGFRFKFL